MFSRSDRITQTYFERTISDLSSERAFIHVVYYFHASNYNPIMTMVLKRSFAYRLIAILIFVFSAEVALAQLKVASLFTDHMVLQRNTEIPVWGKAKAGSSVTVSINGQKQSARAGKDGKWIVRLKPVAEGGPYTMTITSGKENVALQDVMIGEVWLCSGQSNMEWPLFLTDDALRTISESGKEKIRSFTVPKNVSLTPTEEIENAKWEVAGPNTSGGFSAVGYYFAREISRKLNVTVGLIHSSWGGSQAEGWLSKEGLLSIPELKLGDKDFPLTWEKAGELSDFRFHEWLKARTPDGSLPEDNIEKVATQPLSAFEAWHDGNTPGQWEWQGPFWAYRGNGLMMKEVEIFEHLTTLKSTVSLGEFDGDHIVYINGKKVAAGSGGSINVPADTWKAGKNILLIKISQQKEPSWFGLGIPGNDPSKLNIRFERTIIPIGGDGWKFLPVLSEPHTYNKGQNNVAASLYNGMIHPVVPYAIKGFLWYQGESNAGRSQQHHFTFKGLIKDWRRIWKADLPFYFVQLSSYGSNNYSHPGSNWAEMRESQTAALSLPNTGMAATIDIGNPADIHPRNKKDVGYRLALNALAKTYGVSTSYRGPVVKSQQVDGKRIILSFDNAAGGFEIKDPYGYIRGFEVAGSDQQFHFAKATIDGDKIIVSSEEVAAPVAVRYAWSDAPVDANVFNKEGLPMEPFRTDNWKLITDGVMYK